jgi:hypothetical protein
MRLRLRGALICIALAIASIGLVAQSPRIAVATSEPNDEIHVDYGDNAGTSMWVFWHGPDSVLDYGLTSSYGHTATASAPPIKPVDIAGPFWRVQLTGLTPGTVYHYKIGASGIDHSFETAPTGDFVWDDIGDTATTFYDPAADASCKRPWMAQVWQQIADDNPDVVTDGGDISYANDCGVGNVHQFYNDIAPIATQRPIQFSWGNHEYGDADTTAPPGTPRDQLANYKGRAYIAHPQSENNDTASQTGHPGCPPPTGGSGNGCMGSDWGYFTVGHVLFISYGEPDYKDYPTWEPKADAVMAAAQNDPTISFIVTYGHRPAYSSVSSQTNTELLTALNQLGDKYSPAARADGKYVLNVAHHVHGGEAFAPQHGVYQVTNGGGGTGLISYGSTAAGSLWKTGHLEHLRVTATADSMKLEFICGPVDTNNPNFQPCTAGSVLFSETIGASGPPPPPPPGPTEYVTNPSVESGSMTGWLGVYNSTSGVTDVQPAGGAYDGTWALKVTNTASSTGAAGVQNAKPFWVTDTSAGTTYTGSAYVSGPAGLVVSLMLRECTSSGSCSGYTTKTVTLPSSGWAKVVTPFTPAASGNQIRYYLFAKSLGAGQSFYADEFSETSP